MTPELGGVGSVQKSVKAQHVHKKQKKNHSTQDSRVVPHRGTN